MRCTASAHLPYKACMHANTRGCICFVLFFCHLAFTTQRGTPPTCHRDLGGRARRQWKRSALGDNDNNRLLWNPLISSDRKLQPEFYLWRDVPPPACALWGCQVDGLREAKRAAGEVATCLLFARSFDLNESVAGTWLIPGFPDEAPCFAEDPAVSEQGVGQGEGGGSTMSVEAISGNLVHIMPHKCTTLLKSDILLIFVLL